MAILKRVFLNLLTLFSLVVLTIGIYLSYLYTHREFTPKQFKHPIVQGMAIEISTQGIDKDQIHSILNQKFSYLAFGKQMTAYESENHDYVIKFFNPRPPLKEEWFHRYKKIKHFCTLKWFSRAYFRKEERLHKIFQRHKIAFNELREETALVYVHLNKSTAIKHTLEVIDQKGIAHSLDLENVPFALQKKVKLAGSHLRYLNDQNDIEGIRKAFRELEQLFTSRSNKKFTDRIQTLNNNYGFLGDQAIQIDFGRIWKDETLNPEEETEKILSAIKNSWPLFSN
jgi:hypothetical protein